MAASSGRERRDADRVIAYWEEKQSAAAHGAAVSTLALDLAAMRTEAWSHRFLIALGPTDESAALLRYGANFARIFQIPLDSEPPLELRQWLPKPLQAIFIDGCRGAIARKRSVRLQSVIEREDGTREMFRCCFIPIGAGEGSAARFVFGTYGSKPIEPPG